MVARKWVTVLGVVVSGPVLAQSSAAGSLGRPVSFVACPQFRDTARQCWLAESGGKTYYIGAFGIGTPPQLLHKALIEGVAHDDQTSCGAINIDPVQISPLPELDFSCDTVLPDNGTAPREGSLFDLPAEVLARNGGDVPAPPPLTNNRAFAVMLDFDRAVLNLVNQAKVEMIARTIVASPVDRVIITGQAGQSRMDDGSILREAPEVAGRRMKVVRDALIDIGVPESIVEGRTVDSPPEDLSAPGPESRLVTIEVVVARP
jgi:hypothetical protein